MRLQVASVRPSGLDSAVGEAKAREQLSPLDHGSVAPITVNPTHAHFP